MIGLGQRVPVSVRRWVYGLALAALPLLVYYRVVAVEASPLWLAFVLALVNTTSPAEPVEAPRRAED